MQCLLHIPKFNYFFINKYPQLKEDLKRINKDCETKGKLSNEYYILVKSLSEKIKKEKNELFEENIYSPKSFGDLLSRLNPQFSRNKSNDSKELLFYLIKTMHDELNFLGGQKLKNIPQCNNLTELDSFNYFVITKNDLNLSIFSYFFYGILKTSKKRLNCNKISYNFDYFQYLNFPLVNFKNKRFNLYQGFKEYIKPHTMKYYCQICKGIRDATFHSIIHYTPPYLIINIDYGKNKERKE